MKKHVARLCFLSGTALVLLAAAAGPPRTADELARRMIVAHGGMSIWKNAPTVSYEHKMVDPSEEDDPWVSREVVEQGRRRVVQDWPLDGARLVFDGQDVWTTGWKRGNPPKFMVYVSYYIMNLPWLTQDPGVRLEGPGHGRLPGSVKEYLTLNMRFEPGVAESDHDYYKLYIDPRTFVMKGVEHVVTYGALLDLMKVPPEQEFMGPMFKVIEKYVKVDGLLVPAAYNTYSPEGDLYGIHEVKDWSFKKPFDETLLKRPETAVVDVSSPKRAGKAD